MLPSIGFERKWYKKPIVNVCGFLSGILQADDVPDFQNEEQPPVDIDTINTGTARHSSMQIQFTESISVPEQDFVYDTGQNLCTAPVLIEDPANLIEMDDRIGDEH